MTFHIRDAETHKLAKALARETGETMVEAVTVAVRERLERVRLRSRTAATGAELLAIGRFCAATLKGPAVDHATLLYDERGTPR